MEGDYLIKFKIFKEPRFIYFDYLRIICCFFVIMIHVSFQYRRFNINSYECKIAYFYDGISRFSVPNFFMMSGTLFLKKDLSFKIIVRKYIKNILIHLLFWSMFYAFIGSKRQNIDIKIKIIQIIKGHYHLWYLFATIGLYILIPFTKELIRNYKLFDILIAFNIIFLFIIPNYIYIFRYYSQTLFALFNDVFSMVSLNTLTVNNFYFIFGYYLNIKKGMKKELIIILYIAGLIGLFFTTILSYNFSVTKKEKIMFFNPKNFNILFYSTGIFLLFKNHFNFTSKTKITQKLAKFTFGIYLIHPFIIERIIKKYNIFNFHLNTVLIIPIINLFIFLLSLIICIILNYIPFIGKYLV